MLYSSSSTYHWVNKKRVILILVWIFIVKLTSTLIFIGLANDLVSQYRHKAFYIVESTNYLTNAFFLGLYPLAGFLADNKFGRFTTITTSSQSILILLLLEYISVFALMILYLHRDTISMPAAIIVDGLILPIEISLVMFNANIIQFGVDQIQDSPADHQSLFIYWYVWINYLTTIIAQLVTQFCPPGITNFYLIELAFIVMLTVMLCTVLSIVHYKKHWFIIDTARTNPYKLVYRVTKFARQHKVPIRRSAFTYCEDDIPSGLNLGKSKYGGPFTTEQVEDVKAFYGILKIVFALGVIFYLDYTSGRLSINFFEVLHLQIYKANYVVSYFFVQDNIISSTVIVVGIPIFIITIRRYINIISLTMLKRIGVGILLLLLSVICSFVAITVNHEITLKTNETHFSVCLLNGVDKETYNFKSTSQTVSSMALLLKQCLYALSAMFLYPALYEFICAQSPHAMKGMLIGLSFSIRGLFQLIGFAMNVLFLFINKYFISCATDYYILTIVVGVVGLAVYVYVARKYKLRERDEPCHVRRFVEEYYSKIQAEEN